MSSSSYDKVKRAKLSFKGGLEASKKIEKKKKKKQNKNQQEGNPSLEEEVTVEPVATDKDSFELDTGIGHAPIGEKKTKQYEEMFPVETKRFGYHTEKQLTREEALDIRVKQKADRYCK